MSAFIVLDSWPKALTMPLLNGAFDVFLLLWLVPRLARRQAGLAAALLGPTTRTSLTERVEKLTATRAGALEAHGAELRRIERDLHDGTQAQLVAAALTNIAKHSGAGHGRVTVRREPARLTIIVRDDGKGGADPDRGSGLAGLRRRVAALDGTARIDSPEGRGTTLTVDLPCGS